MEGGKRGVKREIIEDWGGKRRGNKKQSHMMAYLNTGGPHGGAAYLKHDFYKIYLNL